MSPPGEVGRASRLMESTVRRFRLPPPITSLRSTPRHRGDAAMERLRQRLMNFDVPDASMAAIEKSRTVPIAIEWTSPRDGIVLERNAIEGMRVKPGDVLFRIADHSWSGP